MAPRMQKFAQHVASGAKVPRVTEMQQRGRWDNREDIDRQMTPDGTYFGGGLLPM